MADVEPATYPHLDADTLAAVDTFVCDMKRKLEQHHNKGGCESWRDTEMSVLVRRLDIESLEVYGAWVAMRMTHARHGFVWSDETATQVQAVIDEAADAANFAMMVADKARELLRQNAKHE